MKRQHVINDPVFGFVNIPNNLILRLIEQPVVQRLKRIKQLGMASFVYPGAQHTRFCHSIGAMYLMQEAITGLRAKGNKITESEADAAMACILLHDIGHGPFSHILEHTIVKGIDHEEISLSLMKILNEIFDKQLDLCISIFKNEYHKKFLHQLVSGQLDVDRLDYLRRDSFFTGVAEANIGSERLIKTMDVRNNNLVVEIKGIHTIENFLLSRRLMYWQVYHHKTAVSAECLLINILNRAKELMENGKKLFATPALRFFLEKTINCKEFDDEAIHHFVNIDDYDVHASIKVWQDADDFVLSTLCKCFVERKLFKIKTSENRQKEDVVNDLKKVYCNRYKISEHEASYFVCLRSIKTNIYDEDDCAINIVDEQDRIRNISDVSDLLNIQLLSKKTERHYMAYLNT